MQKVINGIALFSGCVSLGLVVGGAILYINKDNIVEGVKAQIAANITSSIQSALPGMVDAAVPGIPETTGPAIPSFR